MHLDALRGPRSSRRRPQGGFCSRRESQKMIRCQAAAAAARLVMVLDVVWGRDVTSLSWRIV